MKILMKYLSIVVPVGTLLFLLVHAFALRGVMSFEVFANILLVIFVASAMVLAYYLIHIWKNAAITRDEKIMWTVLMIMFAMVSQVIYWFRFLRKA